MTTLESIFDQAMGLSWRDRARLVEELIHALDPPGDDVGTDDWNREWAAEIRERLAAADRGEIDPRPWRDVCDEIRTGLEQAQ
jgi:putative addiction module component (TIGR02574 family)